MRAPRILAATAIGCLALTLTAPAESARRDGPVATWSDTTVVAATKVTVTVDSASYADGDVLTVERKYPDAWRVVADESQQVDGGLRFVVPTEQYGTATYRVADAPAVGGDPAYSTTSDLTVKPDYRPTGAAGDHSFLSKPRWRYDSCGPVRWRFNARHAPAKGLSILKQSVRRIRAATGLDLTYAGKTTQQPNPGTSAPTDTDTELVLGWLRPSDYQIFHDRPGVVGVGGSRYTPGYKQGDGTKVSRALSGGIVFNAKYNQRLKSGFGTGYTWSDVVLHEFGHVLGLGHVGSKKQLMYPSITTSRARYGAGDLRGLALLGADGGCLVQDNARVGVPRSASAVTYAR